MRHLGNRRGNTVIEFTLIGLPLIFVLISIFEMARGMWLYTTLAHSVKEGVRYAIVKGNLCGTFPACLSTATVAGIAGQIRNAGTGLDPQDLQVTMRSVTPTPGGLVVNGSVTCARLSDCLANNATWPPSPGNAPGVDRIEITATYPFRSMIVMFWPGAGGLHFGTFRLPASSMESVQF